VGDHHPDGLFVGGSEDGLAAPFTGYEACTPELLDVVGDGGWCDADRACHLAYGRPVVALDPAAAAPLPDLLEDGEPVFIGQRLECFHDEFPVDFLSSCPGHGGYILRAE